MTALTKVQPGVIDFYVGEDGIALSLWDAPERFHQRVRLDESGCWIYTGTKDRQGYGVYNCIDPVTSRAHRFSYMWFVGPIPEELVIDHLCRVRACCNPAHLEVVTTAENNRRIAVLKTHCPQGHEYSPENTAVYRNRSGYSRHCLACRKDAARRYRARKRAA